MTLRTRGPGLWSSGGRSPRVRGEKKIGNIFTKFGENFGESPNLVKNQVIKLSQNLVKLNVVIFFSPNILKFLSTFYVIFLVRKKGGKCSPNLVNLFGNHQIW